MIQDIKVQYRPTTEKPELESTLTAFLEMYVLKGAHGGILVQPSPIVGVEGITINPATKGETIDEVCMRGYEATGKVVRSKKDCVTIDLPAGRYSVHYDYVEPWTKE